MHERHDTQVLPIEAVTKASISAKQEAQDVSSFIVARGVSTGLFAAGTTASHVAQEAWGIPWQVTATALGATITALEYTGSNIALRVFDIDPSKSYPEPTSIVNKGTKELAAIAYSSWNGAMSAVKTNDMLGLSSTRARRGAQAGVYGAFVGLWSHPFFRNTVISGVEHWQDHKLADTIGGASGILGGLALYGCFRLYQRHEQRRQQKIIAEHFTVV